MIPVIILCVAFLLASCYREILWARERATLLQRIQAPERAVAEHARSQRPKGRKPAQVIAADDDEAMARAIKEREGVSEHGGSD
jgi:hypothetical protein